MIIIFCGLPEVKCMIGMTSGTTGVVKLPKAANDE